MQKRASLNAWVLVTGLALSLGAALVLARGKPAPDERVGGSGAETRPAAPRPSVLLLSFDTLRPDFLSRSGYDAPTTPYLDALLAEGFHFERATTPIPRTTPALASLLTAAYPHTHGVRRLHDALAEGHTSIAQVLRSEGYQTLAVVTNRLIGRERGLDRGFDVYDQRIDLRTARRHSAATLRRLDALEPGRPVFAWIHYIDPHMPYQPGPALAETFDPGYRGRYREHFGSWGRAAGQKLGPTLHRSPYPKDLPVRAAVHENSLPDDVNAHIRRLYAADLRSADDQLAPVVDRLRERTGGHLLVVFTSDHGESLGEHDYFYAHGDYVYNATTRVPLAFLLPGDHPLHGAGTSSEWVSLVDVAPTLLELLGLDAAALGPRVEGRSLLPAWRGALERRPVFAESGRAHHFRYIDDRVANTIEGRFRAVFLGDWKLIWTPLQDDPERAWQLYDVARDPHETVDRYRAGHPQLPALRDALLAWYRSGLGGEPDATTLSAEEASLLSELGYAAEEDPGD